MTTNVQKPQEQFLTEEDLADIDNPDTTVVIPRGTDPVNEVFRLIGAVIAVSSMLIVWVLLLIGVALRYFTGSSMDFATELPAYLYPWIISGGVIVAMALGGHIAVDFLLNQLSRRIALGTQIGVWIGSGVLFTVMSVFGFRLIEPLTAQITPILGWPQFGSFAAFLTMTICLALQSFARAWYMARHHDAAAQTADREVLGV